MRRCVFALLAAFSILLEIGGSALAAGGDMGGTTQDGSVDYPYLIEDLFDFNEFASNPNYWDGCTRLDVDIDLTSQSYTTAIIAPDVNTTDSGFQGTAFTGVFDGNGFIISKLTIDTADANNNYLGLFGQIQGLTSQVKNIILKNVNITGGNGSESVGGLCGENKQGAINNCSVAGSIAGGNNSRLLAGLCGNNYNGTINNCYAAGTVTGHSFVGGLCGNNYMSTITNCYTVSSVSGGNSSMNLGCLCGSNYGSTITNCYTIGGITVGDGAGPLGGLCGRNNYIIIDSDTAGSIDGIENPSGQYGQIYESIITNCYSLSNVTGGDSSGPLGGLCGSNSSKIINCYSASLVAAGNNSNYLGGLCGHSYGNITKSFWDVETSGVGLAGDNNYGAIGKTTLQMQTETTFTSASWDFAGTWWINDERNYPKLSYQPFADLNNDGLVNFYDFAMMAIAWQATNSDANYNSICELSGDNTIDEADLAMLAELWLQGPLFSDD